MINIKKNDLIELSPDTLCGNGNAIARDSDGFVYFVKGGVPGDKVIAKVIKVTKKYAVAIIDSFIEKSTMRISDGCSVASRCGGCVFQSIDYESECEFKKNTINDDLMRIGGLDVTVAEFVPSKSSRHYRNKAVYPVGSGKDGEMISGFYSQNSHRLCPHEECFIGNSKFTEIRDFVTNYCNRNNISAYNEENGTGVLRHIYIRSSVDGNFVLTIVLNSEKFVDNKTELDFTGKILSAFPECVSICVNVNMNNTNSVLGSKWRKLYGDGYLYDTLLGKEFRIAPASFYQVNHDTCELLYSKAAEFAEISENDTVLDLYCGTGTIGICLAKKGCRLYGIEITPEAVKDAKFNAQTNGVNAEFLCLDAGEALNSDRIKKIEPDVIILDPPRKGCGDEAVERIASFDADRIVYISCDSATLARDLKKFSEFGYVVKKVTGIDMFPRTGHCEVVVQLCRRGK